jgi:regulator of protease activity HflC (stomatin/prohibitin superfamily)
MRANVSLEPPPPSRDCRRSLNHAIVASINTAALAWGAEVLRYEIKDIAPPQSVKAAMDMQAEAERRKRVRCCGARAVRAAAAAAARARRLANPATAAAGRSSPCPCALAPAGGDS